MSCSRSRLLTRRTTASSARSIIRLETYHSGIFSFLCGVFGWQKWSGMIGVLSGLANRPALDCTASGPNAPVLHQPAGSPRGASRGEFGALERYESSLFRGV